MALFMTNAERKRERRRLRRRALREVENAVDAARARRDGLYAKREAQWKEALRELRLGDGDGAKRLLASIAADDAALARLNARLAQFEDIERKMNLADTDAAFDETSSMLASIVNVPLDSTVPKADVTPTQADIDALFGRLSQEAEHEPMHSGKGGGSPSAAAIKVNDDPETAAKWTATKPDGASLADVIGLDDAKAAVVDALVNPVKHPDIYTTLRLAPGTGLLLYGPPGTGKTLFAKAIANELDLPFMEVRCDRLKSKYVGETEKNVSEMFRAARALGKCVLFLDECNAILARRGDQKVCMVEQFLVELDGFAASDAQIFVLMATNLPWTLDSAITRSGRLSEAVYVGLPDLEARRRLIKLAFRDTPLAGDVDLAALAAETDGFSGADIAAKGGLCHKAKTFAARRWVARREQEGSSSVSGETAERVTMADVDAALKEISPVSKSAAELVRRNKEFSLKG